MYSKYCLVSLSILEGVSEDLDFTRYPDKAYQLEWIKNYLGFQAEQSGRTQADVTDRDIEEFYVKCNKFALVYL